jgi:L-lactate dehydrogenase complex protein LldG
MFETFKAKAEAAACQVVRFATRAEALEFILQFMRNEGVAETPGAYAVWADWGWTPRLSQRRCPGSPSR